MPPSNLKKTWGARIRDVRLQRGMTIAQLAYEVGINPGNLSRIERGIEFVNDERRVKIATVLGIDPNDLWSYPEVKAS